MSNLWVSLKRDKIMADVFYKGEKIMTLNVSEQNRGSASIINMQNCKDIKFKIVRNDDHYNKECYNKSSELVDIIKT